MLRMKTVITVKGYEYIIAFKMCLCAQIQKTDKYRYRRKTFLLPDNNTFMSPEKIDFDYDGNSLITEYCIYYFLDSIQLGYLFKIVWEITRNANAFASYRGEGFRFFAMTINYEVKAFPLTQNK